MDVAAIANRIPPLDAAAMQTARDRQGTLTKPPGSLGRLEDLSIQLAGIAGRCPPPVPARRAVVVFAGDHGVVSQGVSAYPQAVTGQMVANFLAGGAAINVLARQAGARVVVVDAGVACDIPQSENLVAGKVGPGTSDMTQGAAMTRDEAHQAIQLGIRVAEAEIARGLDLLACGEMGIGNTTAAAAITAVCTGRSPEEVTGRGTGVDDDALARKTDMVKRAIDVNRPDKADAVDVLAKVGGFEIGAVAGAILAAAAARVPVALDGFIATSGALIACALAPEAKGYLIAAHRSAELGHDAALEQLGLAPLLDLQMRLGEGSGAALAFHLIEAAARIIREMATFGEAGVSTG